jgi:hypothetical protein
MKIQNVELVKNLFEEKKKVNKKYTNLLGCEKNWMGISMRNVCWSKTWKIKGELQGEISN